MNRYPQMALVAQELVSDPLPDAARAVDEALARVKGSLSVSPGQTVALCVGSRKIDNIGLVARRTTAFLKGLGLKVVLVPAMGSHGGATPKGQEKVLESLGVLEALPGVPVHSSMDTTRVGVLECGAPVLVGSAALAADHVVVINRVKPHTKFSGPVESGLHKMLAIGMGKAEGARVYHRAGVRHGFGILAEGARVVLKNSPVLLGLALLEDGFGKLCQAEAVLPENWLEADSRLLKKAYELLPRIPFDNLDVLVVDQIGKDISGIGMDSNVTGRHRDIVGDFFQPPRARRIFVRDLSPGSGGNANGIGLADFTTDRLARDMDREKTFVNALAAVSPEKAALPMHFDRDQKALDACFSTCGLEDPAAARLVRVRNTSRLGTLLVSRALEPEILANPRLSLAGAWEETTFGQDGNLAPFPTRKDDP